MTLKHTIDQEVYTNSILIYPHFDEEKIQEFHWRRKNCYLNPSYEQKISQKTPDLSYQCSILDYRSTIQLVTIDHFNHKSIFSYGTVRLEPDLEFHMKDYIPNHPAQLHINSNDKIEAQLRIRPRQSHIQLHIQLHDGVTIKLYYSFNSLLSKIVAVEGIETNEALFDFSENKKVVLQILKSLKIFAVSGKHIKVSFDSQFKRDLFLLQFLTHFGKDFEKKAAKRDQQINIRQNEERKSHLEKKHISLQNQLNGLFSERQPISPITPHLPQEVLNDIYDILYTPKIPQTENKYDPQIKDGKEAINRKQKNFDLRNQKVLQVEKNEVKTSICEDQTRFTKNFPFRPEQNFEQKYLFALQRAKKLEEQNQLLKSQNKQLKEQIKKFNRKKEKSANKEIPQFIKVLEINKAIRKMKNYPEKEEEKPKKTFHGHRPTKSTFGSTDDKNFKSPQMFSNSSSYSRESSTNRRKNSEGLKSYGLFRRKSDLKIK